MMDFLDNLENEGLLKPNVVYIILSLNFPILNKLTNAEINHKNIYVYWI